MTFKNRTKKLNYFDIGLTKWSAIIFALFVVSAWQGFADWVASVHWSWFLAISLVLAIRPTYNFFK